MRGLLVYNESALNVDFDGTWREDSVVKEGVLSLLLEGWTVVARHVDVSKVENKGLDGCMV